MISCRLKQLRLAHGMTQRQLAQALQIAPSSIGMYEQGRRNPSRQTIKKICGLFHISMEELLGPKEIEQNEVRPMLEETCVRLRHADRLTHHGNMVAREDLQRLCESILLLCDVILGHH